MEKTDRGEAAIRCDFRIPSRPCRIFHPMGCVWFPSAPRSRDKFSESSRKCVLLHYFRCRICRRYCHSPSDIARTIGGILCMGVCMTFATAIPAQMRPNSVPGPLSVSICFALFLLVCGAVIVLQYARRKTRVSL